MEFAQFETPLDKRGLKLDLEDPDFAEKSVQSYFCTMEEFKDYANIKTDVTQPKESTGKKVKLDQLSIKSSNESTDNDSPVKTTEQSLVEKL